MRLRPLWPPFARAPTRCAAPLSAEAAESASRAAVNTAPTAQTKRPCACPEINLIVRHASPSRTEPPGQISAKAASEKLDRDEPGRGQSAKFVTDGLLADQGETEMRPIPAPSATSASAKAEATNAPAMIAAHETPEPISPDASKATSSSTRRGSAFANGNVGHVIKPLERSTPTGGNLNDRGAQSG